ncbi:MAG: RibD family protein [Planctomycetaceae bacterium]
MSLDGRLAANPGQDRWISSPESRGLVHELRSRVDAIAVGIGTALADDPLLTVRVDPGAAVGPRTPLRIVLDAHARLPLTARLVRTARDVPVLVAVGPDAPADRVGPLEAAGCEVWRGSAASHRGRTDELLAELGRRRLTTLVVEGGPKVLAAMFAADQVDEAWVFVAPRILGGAATAAEPLPEVPRLRIEEVSFPGGDVLMRGTLR